MAISLEGIHDIDKLTTYIRAAATLGYVTQLRTALILLYKLNQREFYQEVPTLLVVASGAPQFDYQIEAKPRTLRTIKRVIDSLNWDNGLENHPNRDIRRAIL